MIYSNTLEVKKLANKTPSSDVGLLASLPCLGDGVLLTIKNLQMKNVKYALVAMLVLPFFTHADVLQACRNGDLFDVFTGASCPVETSTTTPIVDQSGLIFSLRSQIASLQAQLQTISSNVPVCPVETTSDPVSQPVENQPTTGSNSTSTSILNETDPLSTDNCAPEIQKVTNEVEASLVNGNPTQLQLNKEIDWQVKYDGYSFCVPNSI